MSNTSLFAKQLRDQAKLCRNANAAALLQEVASWMFGKTIFDEPQELWEHADRLCGGSPNVSVTICDKCGGAMVSIMETAKLCSCNVWTEGKLEDLAVVYDFRMPPQETRQDRCSRCDGDGQAHGSDRPFEWHGPGTYPGPCPVCHGSCLPPQETITSDPTYHRLDMP